MIAISVSDRLISHSQLLTATLRYDLVPVPVTLEFSVQHDAELESLLEIGAELSIGEDDLRLELLKVQPMKTQTIKDGKRIAVIACVAISKGLKRLIEPTKNAVILNQCGFNQAVRACGATISIKNDLPLAQFVCLKGRIPSERIALYLGQEAAVIQPVGNSIACSKIDALFKQAITAKYDVSQVAWVDNPVLKGSVIGAYVSVDADGSTVVGEDTTAGRPIGFRANLDSRQLKNLEKVLVHRGIITRPYDAKLIAGNLVEIDKLNYVILTVAHHFESGALGGHPVMMSKAWLSSLE